MKIAALNIYPVKALGAVALDVAQVEAMGLAGDRRLMLVDEQGTFLTQREEPRLATLGAQGEGDALVLGGPGLPRLTVRRRPDARVRVDVWDSEVDAAAADEATDRALSAWLERPVRLVWFDAQSRRTSSPEWAPSAPVGFADGFAILLTTEASLDALNGRLAERGGEPVPMARFRPNIVVDGAEPWAEDGWTRLAIGDAVLDLVKPCARCVVTTTDQEDGARHPDNEPLATLATFRRSRDRRAPGVLFGWNAVPRREGRVAVGDAVAVLERRPAWPVG